MDRLSLHPNESMLPYRSYSSCFALFNSYEFHMKCISPMYNHAIAIFHPFVFELRGPRAADYSPAWNRVSAAKLSHVNGQGDLVVNGHEVRFWHLSHGFLHMVLILFAT